MLVGFAEMGWAVATVEPNCDMKAVRGLDRIGVESYCPRFRDRFDSRPARPLFPGYVFVAPSSVDGWGNVTRTPGILSVLGFKIGDRPILVSDSIVERLRDGADKDGLILLEPEIHAGSVVRVTRGHLMGAMGLVSGMSGRDRVRVLLTYMGSEHKAHVRRADLALV